jgi:hypothetical protein
VCGYDLRAGDETGITSEFKVRCRLARASAQRGHIKNPVCEIILRAIPGGFYKTRPKRCALARASTQFRRVIRGSDSNYEAAKTRRNAFDKLLLSDGFNLRPSASIRGDKLRCA